MPNICWCTAQAGYPHSMQCPFPYYGRDPTTTKKWLFMQRILLTRFKSVPMPEGICPECGKKIFIEHLSDSTLDPKLVGSCGDAFSFEHWLDQGDVNSYAHSYCRTQPAHLNTRGS